MVKTTETEKKIILASKELFQKNGFDGTKMQAIANLAGINKALLHYYFRSKEQLFKTIFEKAFKTHSQPLVSIWRDEKEFDQKVKLFCQNYITLITKEPFLPVFILSEIQKNPNYIANVISSNVTDMIDIIQNEIDTYCEKMGCESMPAAHFISHLFGMCVYPLIAKPIVSSLFQMDEASYAEFIEERKTKIPEDLLRMLTS